jgi:hypothetical protein
LCEKEACRSTIANLMPAIADTDEEMQESAPVFLDAVVQASNERLAWQKRSWPCCLRRLHAVQPA